MMRPFAIIAKVLSKLSTLLSGGGMLTGRRYAYWGWNRSIFGKSDIHFSGIDYDFILKKVVALDRQCELGWKYINPTRFTVPQYNTGVGYFPLRDRFSVSLNFDHMKYVMTNDQTVQIQGQIGPKHYDDSPITLSPEFLTYEHTNGLNYVNAASDVHINLLGFKNMAIGIHVGIGAGLFAPKSNVKLMDSLRSDRYSVAGYGFDIHVGLRAKILSLPFVATALKVGIANLPNVKTTNRAEDKAAQSFWFGQSNITFGSEW